LSIFNHDPTREGTIMKENDPQPANTIEIRRGDTVLLTFDDSADKPSKKLVPDNIDPPFELYRNGTRIAAVDVHGDSDMDDAHHERNTVWEYVIDDGKKKDKYRVTPGSVWSYVVETNAVVIPKDADYTVTLNGRTYITCLVKDERRITLRHKDGRTWDYTWRD
jgi:hypothetical protein